MTGGLTLAQVLKVVEPDIPTDALGDVLKRLPARFFDQESQLFRPIAPAVLMALDLVAPHDDEGCRCDETVADLVEFVSADPAPESPAWTYLPGNGGVLKITDLIGTVAQRLADLYAAPKPATRRTARKSPAAPIAR